jgi:polyisoprenoid-binding protein YceI
MIAALLIAAIVTPGTYSVDAAASTVRYVVTHTLHEVDAISKEVEGKALVRPDGSVLTEVRAAVASFKSGDGNRDEHMLETMNVGAFPQVTFKGLARLQPGGALPEKPIALQGQVELHGVKKPYTMPITLALQPDGSLRVKSAFDVSLDAHGVERPSLLFVKVDDVCHIAVDLVLRGSK